MADLRAALSALRDEVRELRARLNLSSRNSSKPPSSDPPGTRAERASGRQKVRGRGGQPGHEGKTRRCFSPEDVDFREQRQPQRCHHCDARLPRSGRGLQEPVIHQVVEIPKAPAFVTEYVLHRQVCPCCGVLTRAALPPELSLGAVGPRLQAALVTLTGRYRLSRREAVAAAAALFGDKAAVSLGTLSELEVRTSAALGSAYQEAASAVRTAPVTCADETSFPIAHQKGWLWTACSETVSFFRVDPRRNKEAFLKLLPDFSGVLETDRWCSYHSHPPQLRQLCWAHLKRNFKALVDRGAPGARVGKAGLRAARKVFDGWDDHRAGKLTLPSLARRLAPTRQALERALGRGRANADPKAAALCNNLLKHFISLWTFTRRPGVDPTNNLAEREIRPAVLWRKGSFGCQGSKGARFVERMLTVVRTLRHQGRSVLDFLEETIRAANARTPAPLLIQPG